MDGSCVGILPAAGLASRLAPCRSPKELLPITYVVDGPRAVARPMTVMEFSLRAFQLAGVHRCLVVASDQKIEMLRYFGDGTSFGLNLAYLHQLEPRGLAEAIDLAHAWAREYETCLLLPDTIVRPEDSLRTLRQVATARKADLTLGVFPTDVPEQLGPVRFDENGDVHEVLDKPTVTDLRNTWAMAVWTPRFADFLHEFVAHPPAHSSHSLGDAFNLAVRMRMAVTAVWFPNGHFFDVGTPHGLATTLHHISRGSRFCAP